MEKKVSALLGYVIALALFLFYIFVLLDSKKTDVSTEYSMFYIEDKLMYFLEDGGLENYGTNQEFSYVPDGMYRNQGRGWGNITENGTWTSGPRSYMYFYVDEEIQDDFEYRLKIRTAEYKGKTVVAYM